MRPPQETTVVVRDVTDADRDEIATWRYPGPLAIYDPGDGAQSIRGPDHVALATDDGQLLGYGTTGAQARVPGGSYPQDPEIVDLGLGLRPDLVGQGRGRDALDALIGNVAGQSSPARLRVTVATTNPRATALVTRAGFEPQHRFIRPRDGRAFVQFERDTAAIATSPRYREAREQDIEALMDIRNNVRENALVSTVLTHQDYVQAMFVDGRAWVCELQGQLAGFACGRVRPGDIWALFIREQLEGRGIGTALMDRVERWMFGEGLDRIWLVTAAGTRAERLYQRRGWARQQLKPSGEVEYILKRANRPTR